MGFVEVMRDRNMVAQITHEDELIQHLNSSPRVAYAGFDPTASSLHIGHMIPVLALRRWQQAGHKALALMGGATALIGDPTGKTEMRKMLSADEIGARVESFKKQLGRFLDFSDESKGAIVNNIDWFADKNYLSFLREVGQHFSVNRMMAAECFKQRLEKGLSFLEFNYMILQSYDFYHLYQSQGCTVQLGGDDQWSNMLGGMDLVRRCTSEQVYCMTVPLLANSQGKKMGKTEQGAVWIDPDLTSPHDFFQFFRNVEDDMVATLLNYFTDLSSADVKLLSELKDEKINDAKMELAFHATKLVHGEEEAQKAKSSAKSLFSGNKEAAREGAPEILLNASDIISSANERTTLPAEIGVVDLLVASKIAPSKSEARRIIQQGGLTIEGEKIVSTDHVVEVELLQKAEGLLVKKGKKRFFCIKISDFS